MRGIVLIAAVALLTGCEGLGLNKMDYESDASKANTSWFGNFYGTPAKEESDWFGNFYGTASKTDNCSFYNTCPSGGSGGGFYSIGGGMPQSTDSSSSSSGSDSGW